MSQRVPSVHLADVERVVSREFATGDRPAALALLAAYESNSDQPYRVQLAALKLAHGDLRELQQWIAAANRDYRDVLAAAEYPLTMARSPGSRMVSEEEREQLAEADWRQYQRWLRGS